jgi:tetratricopeptide (TPR) repeat protein
MVSFFEDPEFKSSLAKYEDMVKNHVPAYLEGDELTDIAEYYASTGCEEEAEAVVQYGLSIHPDDVDLLIFKARTLCLHGETEEARDVLKLITDQKDREVQFLLFDILTEEGNREEADRVMEELAADEEYSMEVMVDIMQLYVDNDQPEKAKEWYDRVDKAYDIPELIRTRKRCRSIFCDYYMTVGDMEHCVPLLQEMVDERPYSVGLWNDLATCYIDLCDGEKAHEAVDFALAIDDQNLDALKTKVTLFRLVGNIPACQELLERAVKSGKNFPKVHLLLAKTYLDMRDYKHLLEVSEAINARRDEIHHIHSLDQLNGFLAIGYLAAGKEEESMHWLAKVRNLFCNAVSTLIVTGHCALIYHDIKLALEMLQKAVETSFKLPDEHCFETLIEISGLLFDYKRVEEAADVYKILFRQFPEGCRLILYAALFCFAYTHQTQWFYYCVARIYHEMPEVYEQFGHLKEIKDPKFNYLLAELKKLIENGNIEIDEHLEIPED